MAFIGPWEIALIIVVALIFFGPKKLPELAQSLGKAIREYRKATSSFEELVKEPVEAISKPLSTDETSTQIHAKAEQESKTLSTAGISGKKGADETLIETAKKLGIETKGKTIEQISEEMVERYKAAPISKSKPKSRSKIKSKSTKPKRRSKPRTEV